MAVNRFEHGQRSEKETVDNSKREQCALEGKKNKRENKSIEQKVKGSCLAGDRRGLGVLQQDGTQPPPAPSFGH